MVVKWSVDNNWEYTCLPRLRLWSNVLFNVWGDVCVFWACSCWDRTKFAPRWGVSASRDKLIKHAVRSSVGRDEAFLMRTHSARKDALAKALAPRTRRNQGPMRRSNFPSTCWRDSVYFLTAFWIRVWASTGYRSRISVPIPIWSVLMEFLLLRGDIFHKPRYKKSVDFPGWATRSGTSQNVCMWDVNCKLSKVVWDDAWLEMCGCPWEHMSPRVCVTTQREKDGKQLKILNYQTFTRSRVST